MAHTQRSNVASCAVYDVPAGHSPASSARVPWMRSCVVEIWRAAARATEVEPNTRRRATSIVTRTRRQGRLRKSLWCSTAAATSGWATSMTSTRCTTRAVTGSATTRRRRLWRPSGVGAATRSSGRSLTMTPSLCPPSVRSELPGASPGRAAAGEPRETPTVRRGLLGLWG